MPTSAVRPNAEHLWRIEALKTEVGVKSDTIAALQSRLGRESQELKVSKKTVESLREITASRTTEINELKTTVSQLQSGGLI